MFKYICVYHHSLKWKNASIFYFNIFSSTEVNLVCPLSSRYFITIGINKKQKIKKKTGIYMKYQFFTNSCNGRRTTERKFSILCDSALRPAAISAHTQEKRRYAHYNRRTPTLSPLASARGWDWPAGTYFIIYDLFKCNTNTGQSG